MFSLRIFLLYVADGMWRVSLKVFAVMDVRLFEKTICIGRFKAIHIQDPSNLVIVYSVWK